MIFLDTTVLVYAVGTDHPLRDPCIRLLSSVAEGTVGATTTPAVIQEFLHVRARRRPRSDAVRLARRFASLLSPLAPDSELVLQAAFTLYEAHPALGAFDAVLAAAVSSAHASALVSAAQAFSDVPGLVHVVPDQDGVARLLDA